MERTIKRLNVGAVEQGMYVVQEDDESLATDASVNEHYLAGEQDWQFVVQAQHRADQSRLLIAMYDGESEWTGWGDGVVWALFEGDEPVVQDTQFA